ncbi:hypothetical protein LCGC14_1389730 [marine sediment metagenome]|uniref:Uncharacterized protein n=1 Tax=marine sediment metagenome TaxID=412755 RepID=A0A0F9K0A5_9ZZZZ
MANPQIEDGHIRVATEIWDRLCKIRISGEPKERYDIVAVITAITPIISSPNFHNAKLSRLFKRRNR